ncbi:MAG: PIN domain-containing protein [Actinobacteria bacterium]|nr:PIN domain-containing protein [Actinomycetota bacterium]
MIVVDTSVLIDHLRADPRAHAALSGALRARERLHGSTMTKVEVLAGMRDEEEEETRRLLNLLDWVPVTDPIAELAGELARAHLSSHPGIDPVDYVIAATCEHLGAKLWTRNSKHFPMLGDLPDPYR